jgi:hypothetical protein
LVLSHDHLDTCFEVVQLNMYRLGSGRPSAPNNVNPRVMFIAQSEDEHVTCID